MTIRTECQSLTTLHITATEIQTATTNYDLDMMGFDDVSVMFSFATNVGATDDTVTATFFASDDNVLWVAITAAGYSNNQNATGKTYVCAANSTLSDKVDFDNLNARYFRVTITVTQGGGADWDNLVTVHTRRKASTVTF